MSEHKCTEVVKVLFNNIGAACKVKRHTLTQSGKAVGNLNALLAAQSDNTKRLTVFLLMPGHEIVTSTTREVVARGIPNCPVYTVEYRREGDVVSTMSYHPHKLPSIAAIEMYLYHALGRDIPSVSAIDVLPGPSHFGGLTESLTNTVLESGKAVIRTFTNLRMSLQSMAQAIAIEPVTVNVPPTSRYQPAPKQTYPRPGYNPGPGIYNPPSVAQRVPSYATVGFTDQSQPGYSTGRGYSTLPETRVSIENLVTIVQNLIASGSTGISTVEQLGKYLGHQLSAIGMAKVIPGIRYIVDGNITTVTVVYVYPQTRPGTPGYNPYAPHPTRESSLTLAAVVL